MRIYVSEDNILQVIDNVKSMSMYLDYGTYSDGWIGACNLIKEVLSDNDNISKVSVMTVKLEGDEYE